MLSSASHQGSSPYLVVLFLVAVIGVVQLFSFSLSRKSKWYEYALRYPAPKRPAGKAYGVWMASFGKRGNRCKYSYQRYVHVIFTEEGIYFSTGFILRTFHKPFVMPWNKLNRVEQYEGPFYRKYLLTVEENADEIYLEMMDMDVETLKRFYQKSITAGEPRTELPQSIRPY
jgi:hypothetical protein